MVGRLIVRIIAQHHLMGHLECRRLLDGCASRRLQRRWPIGHHRPKLAQRPMVDGTVDRIDFYNQLVGDLEHGRHLGGCASRRLQWRWQSRHYGSSFAERSMVDWLKHRRIIPKHALGHLECQHRLAQRAKRHPNVNPKSQIRNPKSQGLVLGSWDLVLALVICFSPVFQAKLLFRESRTLSAGQGSGRSRPG